MFGHPHGLVNEPVCGGRQRHARIRRDEGSKPVCHRLIEPDGCSGTLTHDYIVVDGSRANNRLSLLALDVSVDGVRDELVGAAGLVLVDHRGDRAAATTYLVT
jgi:hypothetical protein